MITLVTYLLLVLFHVKPAEAKAEIPPIESAQDRWIDRLEKCESGFDVHAVNPRDSDGTPSYGAFQFKPATFDLFSRAYGVRGELMDPNAQWLIVKRMANDPSVNLRGQFPACVRRLGLPPNDGRVE